MRVEMVQWPEEEKSLAAMRRDGTARLVLVPDGVAPPLTADVLEDWIRLPASDDDIRARVRVLEDSQQAADDQRIPEIAENGLLRMVSKWVSLPPVEHRLVIALLDRYRAVVS